MLRTDARKQDEIIEIMSALLLLSMALQSASGSSLQAAGSAGEQVVVTARRRTEQLEDVPVSVTVLSSDRLEQLGGRTLEQALRTVPNLGVPATGVLGASQPTIRGIFSPVGSATVGLYIDETPIHVRPLLFTGSPNPHLFDLERVEVLRGPQGTLFGASSLGGTIRLITRRADLERTSGEVRTELATVSGGGISYEGTAVAGVPLVADRIGLRSGVVLRRDAGYVDRVDPVSDRVVRRDLNSQTTLSVRTSVRGRLSETLTLTPSYQFEERKSDDLPFFESSRGPQRQAFLVDQPGRDRLHLGSILLEKVLSGAQITSASSFYDRADRRISDYSPVFGELVLGGEVPGLVPPGGTRNRTRVRQRDFTQEVKVASVATGQPVGWVAGLLYRRSRIDLVQEVAEPGTATLVEQLFDASIEDVFGAPLLAGGITYRGEEHVVETELAAFGELVWRATPTIEVSAGLRVSRSRLQLEVASAGAYAGPDSEANRLEERRSETPVTPRVAVSFRPSPTLLLYASASRGFRAGGANTPVPFGPCADDLAAIGRQSSPASYGSDMVWSYEAGGNGQFASGRGSVRGAVFQVHWEGVQQQISLPTCGFSFVDNLGSARSRGFELEFEFAPADGLLFSLALGHADARFRRSLFAGELGDGGEPALLVARGDRVPFAPAWSGSAAAEYRLQLDHERRAYVRAEYQFSGRYQRTPGAPAISYNEAVFRGEAYANALLRAGVDHRAWSASLFADNLFNDRSILFSSADLVPATRTPLRQTTLRPRTVGLAVSLRY
jgi:outer membrane receptor protein involved in Fe transport